MELELLNYDKLDDCILNSKNVSEDEHSEFRGRRKAAKALGLTGKDKRDYIKKLRQEDKGKTRQEKKDVAKQRKAAWKSAKQGGAEEGVEEELQDEEVDTTTETEEGEDTGVSGKGKGKSKGRTSRTTDDEGDDYNEEKKFLGMERKTGIAVAGVGAAVVLGLTVFAIIKLAKK